MTKLCLRIDLLINTWKISWFREEKEENNNFLVRCPYIY